MKPLSITVALFGLLALVLAATTQDASAAGLGVTALLGAFTTFRSAAISSFLKIFVGIFSTETIVFGVAVLAARTGLWPEAYADYQFPESLPLTVAQRKNYFAREGINLGSGQSPSLVPQQGCSPWRSSP